MSQKKTIRVIKKGEDPRKTAKPQVDSARDVGRQIVGTVSNWVIEFQQKRLNETSNALRILSKRSLSGET